VRRVLVTGVSGRLGRAVARVLAAEGVAVTGLDRVAPGTELPVDRMHLGPAADPALVARALDGADAVIHLAAIPAPMLAPPERVFGDNAVGTFVVLDAAGRVGIRRAVIASSQSVLGFAFAEPPAMPLYLPIDAAHPLQVTDPYALSKQADEATARMVVRRYGMTVTALRLPFLGGLADRLTEQAALYRSEPAAGARTLWAYLEDRDAARAAWCALVNPPAGCHVIAVAAPETLAARDTEDLLEEFFPGTPRRVPMPGRTVPWDVSASADVLQFQPEHLYRHHEEAS